MSEYEGSAVLLQDGVEIQLHTTAFSVRYDRVATWYGSVETTDKPLRAGNAIIVFPNGARGAVELAQPQHTRAGELAAVSGYGDVPRWSAE